MKRKKAEEQQEAESTAPTDVFADDAGRKQADPATDTDAAATESELDPVEKLRRERDQLENQLQRTLADLANFRKRRVQEMSDARRGAIEALVGEMLPVLDNFHLAIDYETSESQGDATQTNDAKLTSIREGLLMVRSLLESVFMRHGVKEIPAAGQKFDPAVHEAVGIDPDPEAAEGVVTKVVQRGYTVDDRVLRPTRVMVGGTPQVAEEPPEG